MRKQPSWWGLLALCMLLACSDQTEPVAAAVYDPLLESQKAISKVKLEQVKLGVFTKEMLSNGKLKARQKANISFPFPEQIVHIWVRNGQRVKKGTPLAQLDDFEWRSSLAKARQQKSQAFLDVQDQLISLGFDITDSLSIPAEKWEMAKQNSSYKSHELDIKSAQYRLEQSILRAPFSGVIANLEAKAHNHSSQYEKLCTLIDDQQLEVEFQVMESDLPMIALQQKVALQHFYDPQKTYQGKITQINPAIDENGMIKVWAMIQKPNRHLLEGMNVKVKIKKALSERILIPKIAVVNRQNRSVVFTYEEGKAKWNYVELGLENSQYVSIVSGLEVGQQIISAGHFDLAHDVAVVPDTVQEIH
ncbi:MAG: efflux RND transporter periplasmic adaptor subunit [Bacteroidota bacterium]